MKNGTYTGFPVHLVTALFVSAVLFTSGFGLSAEGQDLDGERQEQLEDSGDSAAQSIRFAELEMGDRIRIILKNGTTFKGQVSGLIKDRIQLDVSYENRTLSGTITFRRREVERLVRLDELSEEARKRIQQVKNQYRQTKKASQEASADQKKKEAETKQDQQKNKSKNASKNEGEQEDPPKKLTSEHRRLLKQFPSDTWDEERYDEVKSKYSYQRTSRERSFLENWKKLQEARELKTQQRYRELIEKFPPKEEDPEEGWSPEKYKKIKQETSLLESKGVPALTAEQREFLEVYDEWKKAYEFYKEQQKKKEQKEKEKKKKETRTQTDQQQQQSTTSSGEESPDNIEE